MRFRVLLLIPLTIFSGTSTIDSGSKSSLTEIAFISDTQAPLWIETIVVPQNRNVLATHILFDSILKDSALSAVFHFGDVTACASTAKAWVSVDSFLTQAHSRNLPVYATLGNHDYMTSAKKGEANFLSRFPECKPTGYAVKVGNTAFVLLNSNFTNLTNSQISLQQTWYAAKLDSLERDSSVKAVVVGCHHPPFTNSKIVKASAKVYEQFALPFIAHKKCILFLSGHCHAIEHFKKQGKDFLVLGGGGGLQHGLRLGAEQKEPDLFSDQSEKRMFHYVHCSISADSISIVVKMISKDFSTIDPVYAFSIFLSARPHF